MRRQLPTHSRTSLAALRSGLSGALGAGAAASMRKLLQSEFGARDVLLTDSGTSALAVAFAATARGAKPLVALPAYACYDLATAADAADARVVLYDIDPHTLAPDPDSLSAALAIRPHALVAVHLFGVPVDIENIALQAEQAGAVVVEDAAQGTGATMHGSRAGSRGTFAVLSFGRGKGISGGGGGALLANTAQAMESLATASHGIPEAHPGWTELARSLAQWLLGRPMIYGAIAPLPFLRLGESIYHAPRAARALSRASGCIVTHIWNEAQADAGLRRATAARYRSALEQGGEWKAVTVSSDATPGYLRFPLVGVGHPRGQAMNAAAALGIMPGYPLPLSRLPGFRARCINADQRFAGAERLAKCLITLPTHSQLSSKDVERVVAWLENV